MSEKIIEAINGLDHLCVLLPASPESVAEAEHSLGLQFAADYKTYVQQFGAISACGIELTGVTTSRRLNVVAVTKRNRAMNGNIPPHMYVIEDMSIDGLVVLQDASGAVYSASPNGTPSKVFESLSAYVKASQP